MKTILMCRPSYFQVNYDINPWMSDNHGKVDWVVAQYQWSRLYDAIRDVAKVTLIDPSHKHPDMVFTANAGFVLEDVVLLSHFNSHERAPEEDIFRQWFLDNNYLVMQNHTGPFEGAGDLFRVNSNYGNRYFLANGTRTKRTANVHKSLMRIDHRYGMTIDLKLVDSRFYHLDTCFCPLDDETVMYYPGAFSDSSRDAIDIWFKNKIEVTEEEALTFCCNAVVIDKNVFMPNCNTIAHKLHGMGYNVMQFDMSEFMKAGGACKCLTLEI